LEVVQKLEYSNRPRRGPNGALCMLSSPTVGNPTSAVMADHQKPARGASCGIGRALASAVAMRRLRLVVSRRKTNAKRRPTERRFRYPAEEVWQVSEPRRPLLPAHAQDQVPAGHGRQ